VAHASCWHDLAAPLEGPAGKQHKKAAAMIQLACISCYWRVLAEYGQFVALSVPLHIVMRICIRVASLEGAKEITYTPGCRGTLQLHTHLHVWCQAL
jgi:hypothetical protein